MRRKLLACLMVVLMASAGAVQASPAYGPTMPQQKQIFMGLENYYVNRRNLDQEKGAVHSHQNYMTLSYGLFDWLSLDLKASLYSTFRHEANDGSGIKYRNSVWGGGYGLRLKAYESGAVKVVAGLQHFSIHPRQVMVNGEKHYGILEDWQASVLASYDFKKCIPYAGIRYTMMDYIHTRNNDRKMIKSDQSRMAGLIAGVDIPLNDRIWINLESDWQDGGSATAGIRCRF